jgi:signal peptidase I
MFNIFNWWKKVCSAHLSEDETVAGNVRNFFLPKLTRGFYIRMGVTAIIAAATFRYFLIPCVIDGESMMPTFPAKGFTLCWTGSYFFSEPKIGDVVIVKYLDGIYFLKRVVAKSGDVVQFKNGTLFVNNVPQKENYVKYFSDWNTKPTTVSPNHLYVVGDNRSQFIENHIFGQVLTSRIIGSPLF